MKMSEAPRNQIIERCVSVIRQHPNSGTSLGPIKKWLEAILDDKTRGKELRDLVKEPPKDRALADKVCTMAERFSERAGEPWKRNLGKAKERTAAKPKKETQADAAEPSSTPEEGWRTAGKKNKPKAKEQKERCDWAVITPKLEPFS